MNFKEQTVVEHLEEFRKRFVISLIFYIIIFVISLFFSNKIYKLLTYSFHAKLIVLGPDDILNIYIMLASVSAISLSLPFICYQIFAYIKPALEEREAKMILNYIPAIFILFILGLSFGFFVVTPALLHVLLSLGDNLFSVQLTAHNYLQFILHTSLPIAIIFEMPVITAFLTSLYILSPQFLIKNRRYGYFILLVLAVILTPADFISDLTMTVPLILIYEISVFVSKRVDKKRKG